jgi:hypothetical protein
MKSVIPNLFSVLSILLLVAVNQSSAQTPQSDDRPRTASIGGRVTVGGAAAPNALVTVAEADPQSWGAWFGVEASQRAPIEVRTDRDGRYRVAGLADGSYVIRALSKAYVLSKSSFGFDAFRTVTLDESESRDDIDIALVRGGMITGRVIDSEGRPVIGAVARLFSVDEKGMPAEEFDSHNGYNEWMFQTDDRGVYRIYGLAAGRYIIGAGGEWASGIVRRKTSETFYPDATDRNQAKIIEVKEGAEVVDIDIRLGDGKDAFDAAGRVVDADTGRPLPRISVLCMEAHDKKNGGSRYGRPATTDDEGRFRCADLTPGQYELSLWERIGISREYYSEKISFDVADSDLSGLEVKAIRGATISGVVVIEGVSDPAVKAKLQRMSVGVRVASFRESAGDSGAYEVPARVMARIAIDGGFRLTGAPPGMASFYMEGDQDAFSIRRIERDGAEIRSAFEIGRGEQITAVRIVVAQANETIRGQVETAGVNLPAGCQLHIWATPIKTIAGDEGMTAFQPNGSRSVVADEKGRFVIERLIPGEYELKLNAMIREGQYYWSSAPGTSQVKQRVTVGGGAETVVKLTLVPARR